MRNALPRRETLPLPPRNADVLKASAANITKQDAILDDFLWFKIPSWILLVCDPGENKTRR